MSQSPDKLFYSSFNKLDAPADEALACIVSIGLDNTSHFQHGTHRGPQAILRASHLLESFDFESKTSLHAIKLNHVHVSELPSSNTEALEMISNELEKIPNGQWPLFLGGEQTLARAAYKFVSERFANPSETSILYLDAHADLKNSYQGSGQSHRCTLRALSESSDSIVLAGLRNSSEDEWLYSERSKKITTFSSSDLLANESIDKLLSALKENVYISLDLSILDPSECPAVSHPEPNGISFERLNYLLQRVFKAKNVIGMDICELCPSRSDSSSEYLAAKLVQKVLRYKFLP